MTGNMSKERMLNDIIYFCERAKDSHIKRRYNMKQLEQLYIDAREMVRTKRCLGL